MSDHEPIFRKLYVGIRPRLHLLTKAGAGAVYMYLLSRQNHETGRCDPAVKTIAADLKMDDKTIDKALKTIEASGVARRSKRAGMTDNWTFAVLDIADVTPATSPVERVTPKHGVPHGTGGGVPRNTGGESPRRTGYEGDNTKEEKKEAASGLSGADAPVVLPANECDEPEGYFSDDASGTPAAEQSVSEAGKAVGMNTAVPAKAKSKAAKVSKPKAQPLTDDDKLLVCGSLAMMERWLLWGGRWPS